MLALFNIESWLENGGLLLLAAIVFAESGLLIGFFLPGDSLLFIAGFFTAEGGGNHLPTLPVTALVVLIGALTFSARQKTSLGGDTTPAAAVAAPAQH